MKSATYIFASYFQIFLNIPPEQLALLLYFVTGGIHF